ncbi:MAG: glycosyltransferase family 39 protein, partial [Candidatus Promineifilaceae bacterium]
MGRTAAIKPVVIGVLLMLLMVGFGLRLFSLEGQSMWSDEGLSYYRSGLSLGDILRNIIVVDGVVTRDTNPTLYFLLLHYWRILAGDTVFAMRFLSAAAGMVSIPLTYALSRRTFGQWAGIVAALLMAISPFHVWQSQIVRNYGLLLTVNLFAVYALFAFLFPKNGRTQWKWFLLWLAASLAGIYTHYFGFFILAFGLFCLGVTFLFRQRHSRLFRPNKWWLVAGAAILLLIPVVSVAFERFSAGQQIDFHYVPLPDYVHQAVSAFAVGMNWNLVHVWWRWGPVTALALLGVWLGWRRSRQATLFLV